MRVGYIVIFTSKRKLDSPDDGYEKAAHILEQEVKKVPGFIKMDSVRDLSGNGITISYWETDQAVIAWKKSVVHAEAKSMAGKWYDSFEMKAWKVESPWNP